MWRYPGTQQVSGWQLASLWAQNFCHSLVSFYNLHHRPTDTPGVRGGGWGRWGRGATTPGETPHSHSRGFGFIPDRTYGKKSGGTSLTKSRRLQIVVHQPITLRTIFRNTARVVVSVVGVFAVVDVVVVAVFEVVVAVKFVSNTDNWSFTETKTLFYEQRKTPTVVCKLVSWAQELNISPIFCPSDVLASSHENF